MKCGSEGRRPACQDGRQTKRRRRYRLLPISRKVTEICSEEQVSVGVDHFWCLQIKASTRSVRPALAYAVLHQAAGPGMINRFLLMKQPPDDLHVSMARSTCSISSSGDTVQLNPIALSLVLQYKQGILHYLVGANSRCIWLLIDGVWCYTLRPQNAHGIEAYIS